MFHVLCSFLACLGLIGSQASAAVLSYQPDMIYSVNGTLEVTLDLDYIISLEGRRIAPAYNGEPVGPTLRVKPGDKVSVTLANSLPPGTDLDRALYDYTHDRTNEMDNDANMTVIYNRLSEIGNVYDPVYGFWGLNYANIHFHGADVPLSIEKNSEAVDGGENITYTFTVPENQEPGLMWYHQHFHGTVSYGYMSGQYGFFVIEGTDEDITKAPGVDGATEVFMMLSEYNPANASVAPSPPLPFFPIAMSFDWTALVNGQDGDTTTYQFDQGEMVLFRVAHAGVEPTYRINIENHTMTVIGYDGFPVPEPMQVETLEMGTGQRVEFLVYFSTPGNYTMTRQPWNSGITGVEACTAAFGIPLPRCVSYDLEKVIANIEVLPSAMDNETMMMEDPMDDLELPSYNQYHQDLANKAPVDRKTILMQQQVGFPLFQLDYSGPFVPPGVGFGMNDRFATPFHVHGTVQAGTCETWDIISDPPSEHTFHIHASDFLVTHADGVAVESPYWRDTLIVYENATIHVCFDRVVPGDHLLFHCHMPSHQDIGMAGFYSVVEEDTSTPPSTPSPPSPTPPTPPSPTPPTPDSEPTTEPTSGPSGAMKLRIVMMSSCVMLVVILVNAW